MARKKTAPTPRRPLLKSSTPERSRVPPARKARILQTVRSRLAKEERITGRRVLGRAWCPQDALSVEIYGLVGAYNYNQIIMAQRTARGAIQERPGTFTFGRWAEQALLRKTAKLLRLKFRNVAGYVTAGGTEANIYALWLSRSWARAARAAGPVEWLIPESSHYSISKALELLDVARDPRSRIRTIARDEALVASRASFESELSRIAQSDRATPVVIVLTAVATETGLVDPIREVIDIAAALELTNVFIHVDACFGGLTLPFTREDRDIFGHPRISTIAIDYHKTVHAPIGAAAVFVNDELERFAAIPAPYLPFADLTLAGSRNGLTVLQTWALLEARPAAALRKDFEVGRSRARELYDGLLQLDGFTPLYTPRLNYLVFTTDYESEASFEELTLLLSNYAVSASVLPKSPHRKNRHLFKLITYSTTPRQTVAAFLRDLRGWVSAHPRRAARGDRDGD